MSDEPGTPRGPDRSSRTTKTDVEPVDGCSVLQAVASLRITEWSYQDDPEGIRHMGPLAEEFHDTFGLGVDDAHIAPLDSAGVALAAIQGLLTAVDHCEDRLSDLEQDREHLERRVGELERALEHGPESSGGDGTTDRFERR